MFLEKTTRKNRNMLCKFNKGSIFIFLLVTGFTFNPYSILKAQVNTEKLRMAEIEEGFHAASGLNFQLAKGNSDYLTWDAQLRFDFKHRRYHTFLVVEIKQGEQHEERFLNKGFMHGRAVRTFSPGIAAEVFAQIEYDDFIKLRERKLAGAGARIRLLKTKNRLSLFWGTGFMREHELYSNPRVRSKLLTRSTNYLTGRYNLNYSQISNKRCLD